MVQGLLLDGTRQNPRSALRSEDHRVAKRRGTKQAPRCPSCRRSRAGTGRTGCARRPACPHGGVMHPPRLNVPGIHRRIFSTGIAKADRRVPEPAGISPCRNAARNSIGSGTSHTCAGTRRAPGTRGHAATPGAAVGRLLLARHDERRARRKHETRPTHRESSASRVRSAIENSRGARIARHSSPSGRRGSMEPMQPRSAPPAAASRSGRRPGEPGSLGGVAVAGRRHAQPSPIAAARDATSTTPRSETHSGASPGSRTRSAVATTCPCPRPCPRSCAGPRVTTAARRATSAGRNRAAPQASSDRAGREREDRVAVSRSRPPAPLRSGGNATGRNSRR